MNSGETGILKRDYIQRAGNNPRDNENPRFINVNNYCVRG